MLNESQGNLPQLEDRLDEAFSQQPVHHPATGHSAH